MTKILLDVWTIHDVDNHIFDNMHVPEGSNKQIIVETIMRETMGLNVIVNEPLRLRRLIQSWSQQRLYVWNRLFKTLAFDYNPIENYDRIEERVDRNDHIDSHTETGSYDKSGDNSGNVKDTGSRNGTNGNHSDDHTTRTPNLTTTINSSGNTSSNANSESNGADTHNGTDTHNVWGFNVSEKSPSYEDITTTTDTSNNSSTTTTRGEDTLNGSTKNTGTEKTDFTHDENGQFDENTTGNRDETGHFTETQSDIRNYRNDSTDFNAGKMRAHGNIGVTTTQQMIQQERDISLFDFYQFIADDFKREFCIMIY